MSVAQPLPPETASPDPAGPEPVLPTVAQCPYLISADGAWRRSVPSREHRCAAVTPPAPLIADKQRALCLTEDHLGCATFLAAESARAAAIDRPASLPRPIARTAPVILDSGRVSIAMPGLRADRSTGQALLVVLLVLAFVAILIAKLSGAGGGLGVVAATTSPHPSASLIARPSARTSPNTSTVPATSDAPTSSAKASPATSPGSTKTYTVKKGDTLIGIAARYGTTTKAIIRLNDLKSPSALKIGQVLKLP
jgi:LysM repeat protein